MENILYIKRMILIELAKIVAECLHCNQKYGDYDYMKHLDDVYNVLVEFGITDTALLVSAYLHDAPEDQKLKFKLIEKNFGKEIADITYAVTDEEGRNRQEKKLKTYPKIKANPKAIILKLADRIANVRYSIESGNWGKFKMYSDEYTEFRNSLLGVSYNLKMWELLFDITREHFFERNKLKQVSEWK